MQETELLKVTNNELLDGISIIICCYNSEARLPETIRHLGQLQIPYNINWEVIVVDNASTDNTATVAKTEWAKTKCSASCRIISQPISGKTNALILGMDEAIFSYYLIARNI